MSSGSHSWCPSTEFREEIAFAPVLCFAWGAWKHPGREIKSMPRAGTSWKDHPADKNYILNCHFWWLKQRDVEKCWFCPPWKESFGQFCATCSGGNPDLRMDHMVTLHWQCWAAAETTSREEVNGGGNAGECHSDGKSLAEQAGVCSLCKPGEEKAISVHLICTTEQ